MTKPKTRGKPFQKGNRASPGRTPIPVDIVEACRLACPKAVETILSIATDTLGRPADRLRACELLLNRGYGSPRQALDLSVEGPPAFPSVVTIQIVDPKPWPDDPWPLAVPAAPITDLPAPDVPQACLDPPQGYPPRAPGGIVFATVPDRPPPPRRGSANPIFSW